MADENLYEQEQTEMLRGEEELGLLLAVRRPRDSFFSCPGLNKVSDLWSPTQ